MNEFKKLLAEDGHELNAYVTRPEAPVGAIVLLQEIFGVNAHIRSVADQYAVDGFYVIAPELFDRVARGVELSYQGEDMERAVALMGQLRVETALLDIAAAFRAARETGTGVGVLGFCYGGFLSWLTATRGETIKVRPDCCVAYYPGGIGKVAAEEPFCPVMLHFGKDDTHIGSEQIEAVRSANRENVEIFEYTGAEHGFNCDARGSFSPQAALLARDRTLAFFRTHIA